MTHLIIACSIDCYGFNNDTFITSHTNCYCYGPHLYLLLSDVLLSNATYITNWLYLSDVKSGQ